MHSRPMTVPNRPITARAPLCAAVRRRTAAPVRQCVLVERTAQVHSAAHPTNTNEPAHRTNTINKKETNTTMNITPLNSRNSKPNRPVALEDRLAQLGLTALHIVAAALVTTNRGIALQVATTITALPYDENAPDDQQAEALERLATLATTEAAKLRGTPGEGPSAPEPPLDPGVTPSLSEKMLGQGPLTASLCPQTPPGGVVGR